MIVCILMILQKKQEFEDKKMKRDQENKEKIGKEAKDKGSLEAYKKKMENFFHDEKIKADEERKINEDIKALCQSVQMLAVFNKYEKQIRQLFVYYIESCGHQLVKYSADTLLFKGFIMFNSEFAIIPSVLQLFEVQSIFRSLTKNKSIQDESPVIGLSYDEFKEALLRISIKKKEIFDQIYEKTASNTVINQASMHNLIKDMNGQKEDNDPNDEPEGIRIY